MLVCVVADSRVSGCSSVIRVPQQEMTVEEWIALLDKDEDGLTLVYRWR